MMNNTYAVITGASGGLGTSFALECAEKGYDLLLLDLPNNNLTNLGQFLNRNYPIQVKTLEVDLTEKGSDLRVLEAVQKEEMRVGMLINNAGLPQNDFFEDTDHGYLQKMIEVNCMSFVTLTKALLPELKKQAQSHIINVSSLGSYYALPRKTCYSATKGFVRQFSQALRLELIPHGVNVSILCPGPMTTNINNYVLHRQLNWFSQKMMMHPRKVANITVKKALAGEEIVIPGRVNRFLHGITSVIPGFVKKKLLVYSMKQLQKK